MPSTKVIDLSNANKIPENLRLARNEGVVGMVHQATAGTVADTKAEARVFLAKDAGMRVGLYHVLAAGPVRPQVDAFLTTAEALGLEDNWLLAVKYEGGVKPESLVEFLEAVEDKTDRSPVLYIAALDAKNLKGDTRKLSQYRLWLAQHDPVADVPVAWGKFFLWEYTDQGTVSGVNPPVACSDSLLDDEAIAKAWAGFEGKHDDSLPEAAPVEEGAPVEEKPEPEKTPEGELEHGVPDTPSEGNIDEEAGEHPPPQ